MAQVVTPLSKEVPATRRSVRALLLGDRIDTSGLDQTDVISTAPMTFRAGHSGLVAVFRFGVVVLFDLSVLETDDVLRRLSRRDKVTIEKQGGWARGVRRRRDG